MQSFVVIPSRVKQAKKQGKFFHAIKVKSFKDLGKQFYSKVSKANDQLSSAITADMCNDDGMNSF